MCTFREVSLGPMFGKRVKRSVKSDAGAQTVPACTFIESRPSSWLPVHDAFPTPLSPARSLLPLPSDRRAPWGATYWLPTRYSPAPPNSPSTPSPPDQVVHRLTEVRRLASTATTAPSQIRWQYRPPAIPSRPERQRSWPPISTGQYRWGIHKVLAGITRRQRKTDTRTPRGRTQRGNTPQRSREHGEVHILVEYLPNVLHERHGRLPQGQRR